MILRHEAVGFTLVEMLVTMAIVALLATMVLPLAEVTAKRSKESELRSALRDIRGAIDDYKQAVDQGHITKAVDKSNYPESLKILVDGVPDAGSPDKKVILRFLRRIPRDPFFTDPTRPDDETWGKRSYASPADAPEEGADVYDVYSLAIGTGLNGIPYKNW